MTLGAASTAADAIADADLDGRVVVITGASGGIGLETARVLASVGAHVVLGNRASPKSDAAIAGLRKSLPGARADYEELDLTSLDSTRRFARRILERLESIDILINNAGVMASPFDRTVDGFELQFGTNHLGHFLLTGLLLPSLIAGAPARVVNLSSSAHHLSDVRWDDPNYHVRPYSAWEAYAQSKTANVLFTVELERRFGPRGLHAFAVHPGVVDTGLMRYLTEPARASMDARIAQSGAAYKTTEQGAATTVFAATAAELDDVGGVYLEDCHVSGQWASHAHDEGSAKRLWSMSEKMLGQTFARPISR